VRELLWTLAAAGIEPSDEEGARVAEIAPETVARSVLRRLRHLPEAHPIVRTAVYTSLSPTDRARGHGRAARLLVEQEAGADRVAIHLLAAPPLEEAWAVEVLCKAASAAVARGAPEVGTAFFERALAEPLSRPARADMLVDLAAAEVASLPPPAGIEHLNQALALAEDPRKRALISLELGRAYLATLKIFEAVEVLERALSEIESGERSLRERVEAQLLNATTMALSTAPRAERRLAELFEEARAGRLTDKVLPANVAAFAVCAREPTAQGAALAERALAGGELVGGRDPLPICFAASALIFSDRLADARQVCSDALAEARRKGSLLMFSLSRGVAARIDREGGGRRVRGAGAHRSSGGAVRATVRGLRPDRRAHRAGGARGSGAGARREWNRGSFAGAHTPHLRARHPCPAAARAGACAGGGR
jgi:tetratricopeptide (TPR) repeat protein